MYDFIYNMVQCLVKSEDSGPHPWYGMPPPVNVGGVVVSVLLLMEEILHHLGCIKPFK